MVMWKREKGRRIETREENRKGRRRRGEEEGRNTRNSNGVPSTTSNKSDRNSSQSTGNLTGSGAWLVVPQPKLKLLVTSPHVQVSLVCDFQMLVKNKNNKSPNSNNQIIGIKLLSSNYSH
jgi:hypothetical protein